MGKVCYRTTVWRSILFSYGLAKVKIDGKYGFIDYEGDMYIEAIYDDVKELKVNR